MGPRLDAICTITSVTMAPPITAVTIQDTVAPNKGPAHLR